MNIAWIAALLAPRDVIVKRDAPNEGQPDGPSRFAAVVLGGYLGSLERRGETPSDLISIAAKCLVTETLAAGVTELASRLTADSPADRAEAASFAVLGCTAAAELDDYDLCLQLLDTQITRTSDIQHSDDALLQAVLLQQKALRLRDAGKPYLGVSVAAAVALSRVDADQCSAFLTRRGPGESSDTVTFICNSLGRSIATLIPRDAQERTHPQVAALLDEDWSKKITLQARTASGRASTYAEYVRLLFGKRFNKSSTTVIGGTPPDLFADILALELIADSSVYSARKELALLRLLQSDDDASASLVSDTMRLLRHAFAKKELDLAIGKIRNAGPLSALILDARQVLGSRTSPETLRTVEMQVLRAAAELLAPAEARLGLDAVRASLTAGGPPDLPGAWQLKILRKEMAWMTAAALGNACNSSDEVALLLLSEATVADENHDLLDTSLRRAVGEIEWEAVSERVRADWLSYARNNLEALPLTAERVLVELDRGKAQSFDTAPMGKLIERVNSGLRGESIHSTTIEEGVPLLRAELAAIRADAQRGQYSLGGVRVADVAAGLMVATGTQLLWRELADFLLDPLVQRDDRSPALDRLARNPLVLPTEIALDFGRNAMDLLYATSTAVFETLVDPYPSALRFLATHGLIDDVELYDALTRLSGASSSPARKEAAITVAVLSAKTGNPDLLTLALPLSRDDDVETKAHAGRALACLAGTPASLSVIARRRLVELLEEDGLLTPLLVLRQLRDIPGMLQGPIGSRIEQLSHEHPSRSVRIEASKLLVNS